MNRRVFVTGVLGLLVSGCRSIPPLANTRPSPEALATAVLDALVRRDRGALEALALSEREFRDHVWPELPAARPERNLPFSYVWGDLHQKSEVGLGAALRAHGGQAYILREVTFGEDTAYQSYTVRRAATFHVRDAAGADLAVRVCGSMIEKGGSWKVFSYVVDAD